MGRVGVGGGVSEGVSEGEGSRVGRVGKGRQGG